MYSLLLCAIFIGTFQISETFRIRRAAYGPPRSSYGPPTELPTSNYGPPRESNYGPPSNYNRQSNYGPSHYNEDSDYDVPRYRGPPPPWMGRRNGPWGMESNYGRQNYGNYGHPRGNSDYQPPRSNYGPPPLEQPRSNYGPPRSSYGRPLESSYAPKVSNYGPPQRGSNYAPADETTIVKETTFSQEAGPGALEPYTPTRPDTSGSGFQAPRAQINVPPSNHPLNVDVSMETVQRPAQPPIDPLPLPPRRGGMPPPIESYPDAGSSPTGPRLQDYPEVPFSAGAPRGLPGMEGPPPPIDQQPSLPPQGPPPMPDAPPPPPTSNTGMSFDMPKQAHVDDIPEPPMG